MNDIRIRPAETRDLDRLVGLLEELFAIEADFAFDPVRQRRGLELLLREDGALVLVAERAGEAVAMASVQTVISTAEGGRVGWVEDVVVATGHRGLGIGGRLLEYLEGWAGDAGLSRLQLLADRGNAPALEFYRRRGWSATSLVALRTSPPSGQGSTVTPRQKAT